MVVSTLMSRRTLLQSTGGLIVTFAIGAGSRPAHALETAITKSVSDGAVDSFLSIDKAGKVTVFIGKIDYGTGVRTGFAQLAAEELSVELEDVTVVEGDTSLTPDQGPSYGSLSIEKGGTQLRQAAATAHEALIEMAAKRLDVPIAGLTTRSGRVWSNDGRDIGYGDLAGGGQFELGIREDAPLKDPSTYKIVGKPIPRPEIPGKVTGGFTYIQDFRLENMLFGVVVRPPAIGASLEKVDEDSVSHIEDMVRIVQKDNFLAVTAKSEWSAIRAARELKVQWSASETLPDQAKIWEYVRNTPIVKDDVTSEEGDVSAAFDASGRTIEATYDFAIHTHGSIGPSCSVSQFEGGQLINWSSSQATHRLRDQLAAMFSLDKKNVRCIYMEGAGCYGRNGNEDAAADSAFLAKEMGQPVRVQWTRSDEHGWDPKGPPTLIDMRARLDDGGELAAWQSAFFIPQGAGGAVELLGASLAGLPTTRELNPGGITNDSAIPYRVSNVRTVCHRLETTPLRPSWIRTPGRMQNTFANEAFFDEVCAEKGVDPIEMRLKMIDQTDTRGRDILERLKVLSKWESRPSPRGDITGTVVSGRGMAYVKYELRRTYVGGVAEVEVDRNSGDIRVTRFFVTHDCGQIVNPLGVRSQIEGNVIQTTSRTLLEEVTFDRSMVTTLDWASYPILRFDGVPEVVIELIDRPGEPLLGVGEPTSSIVSAAISNAVFDATGARLRSVPFKPEKVRAALAAAG